MYNKSVTLGQNVTAISKHYFAYSSLTSALANPSWNELQQGFWRLGHGLGHMQSLWADIQSRLQPGVRFYLTVLLTIAAANSLFILVSPLEC